jgi:hypothetical protein
MKILVFAPHAAIWVHAFPEALIVETLRDRGHDIIYVGCDRIFDRFCIPMAGHRLSHTSPAKLREDICKECKFNDSLLRTSFGFTGPTLRETLTSDDLREIENIIAKIDRTSIATLEVEGVPVGKVAVYQIVLRHKRFDLDFNDVEWDEYRIELRNALYALKAAKNLINHHRPDRLMVYNGLYSVNRVASLLAEANGIPAYFLHAGANLSNRLQTMMLGRGTTLDWISEAVRQWPRVSELPCAPEQLSLVSNHFLELVRGRNIFVYSQGRKSGDHFDMRSHFGIGDQQKIIVATMSSYDEEMAVIATGAQAPRPTPCFPEQVDWILAVVDYVRSRTDLFLVVRVHPREFPNRRDGKKSQHAIMLESVLDKLPPNAVVNWPHEHISLYDLADQTDVFLNAWSSAGKEMAMLGIPVVIYSRDLPQYPADVNYIGETKSDYFSAIDQALRDGWSFEAVRRAYRWLAFEFIKATIFLGDSYPKKENPDQSLLVRAVNRLRRILDSDYEKKKDMGRRLPHLDVAEKITGTIERAASTSLDLLGPDDFKLVSTEEETAALRGEMKRIAGALFPTPASKAASRLFKILVSSDPDHSVSRKRA